MISRKISLDISSMTVAPVQPAVTPGIQSPPPCRGMIVLRPKLLCGQWVVSIRCDGWAVLESIPLAAKAITALRIASMAP